MPFMFIYKLDDDLYHNYEKDGKARCGKVCTKESTKEYRRLCIENEDPSLSEVCSACFPYLSKKS